MMIDMPPAVFVVLPGPEVLDFNDAKKPLVTLQFFSGKLAQAFCLGPSKIVSKLSQLKKISWSKKNYGTDFELQLIVEFYSVFGKIRGLAS